MSSIEFLAKYLVKELNRMNGSIVAGEGYGGEHPKSPRKDILMKELMPSLQKNEDGDWVEPKHKLLDIKILNYSAEYVYHKYEVPIAMYAVTQVAKEYPSSFIGWGRNISQGPTTVNIQTDHDEWTAVFEEVFIQMEFGSIQTVFNRDTGVFSVFIGSGTSRGYRKTAALYERILEHSNFFQGKTIKFDRGRALIVQTPDVTFDSVVLPEKLMADYQLNVVEFLTDPKLQESTKRRSVILSGPPGVGKTSLVAASFRELNNRHLTAAYVTTDTFRGDFNLEDMFRFCCKYLSPVAICFEDIDLVGYSRENGRNDVIGPLLTLLNGIEETHKPLVFIATTNRFDVLDAALTRPCRIDRRFTVAYPTKDEIEKMFQLMLQVPAPASAFGLAKLTGAHIREIMRTAKILGAKNSGDYQHHVEEAVQIVKDNFYLGGPTKAFGFANGGSELLEVAPPAQANERDDFLRRRT